MDISKPLSRELWRRRKMMSNDERRIRESDLPGNPQTPYKPPPPPKEKPSAPPPKESPKKATASGLISPVRLDF
jgi:hypothetical protein